MVEYLRPMVEEVIDKKLAAFSKQFEKLKSELNAKFEGLKEQAILSMLEEVASRHRKDYGKKWPSNAQVSYMNLRIR